MYCYLMLCITDVCKVSQVQTKPEKKSKLDELNIHKRMIILSLVDGFVNHKNISHQFEQLYLNGTDAGYGHYPHPFVSYACA